MKPFLTLDQTLTADGSEISLHSRDGHFYLRVNREPLMATHATESERVMARLACEPFRMRSSPRILVGGLGLGFTLAEVLKHVGRGATVLLMEMVPEIVKWNREFLSKINGNGLADPRVRTVVGDVRLGIQQGLGKPYDAILLDVDNGPQALVQRENQSLYDLAGLGEIRKALKPGGRVTFWSANPDRVFQKRLGKAGFAVEVVGAKAYPTAKREAHTIFVADRPKDSERGAG